MRLRQVLYGLCAVSLIIGTWGIVDRLRYGHQTAAYGSYVVWGLWVAMYLFFAGLAAGAFMVASLDLLFKIGVFRGIGRLALWVALVSLAAGLLQVWLDIGHMSRIWKVYLQANLGSVMAQMVWGYTLFGLLIAATLSLALWVPQSWAIRALMLVGLPLSLFVSGAVGALLGVQASRLFWHVGLFPVQFPVFSLATGVAAVMAAIAFFGPADDPRRGEQLRILAIATVALAVVKLYFLWADFSQSLYGNIPHNVEAVNAVLFGRYWWAFWIGQILVGTLVPVVILSWPGLAREEAWAGWMGVLVLAGLAVARANIVFPALAVPEIEALSTAFSGPHLTFDYFPSLMEWAVAVGIIGAAVLAFILGRDVVLQPRREVA
ncbi:MAG: NrfD/PsrC family molybdoenzyme membrane anchor subunit [Armatimonadota bacterium]|nr:NrfD/PsrC family molybdoenzyme membrane anchor subunit [Armatimonadota bacterium]MDR7450841.1 NrfD/PsrC family molybdoenzyme membrane anchor subunit [Armatimonadota bacterium]MDR7465762.1 NrfD/PsrC family molybdoenzyme membrane anchor subunit [Armatimonadota bacterium]MDR7493670.1 NrfD/PsrC family molybdoenzyme membrane anchor subunit [Armatimonadota bacterium]MDR7499081.1 NrfD/PsrC family molybdoenzyme membrane anchor subunit [Armatimonadota bacterium]